MKIQIKAIAAALCLCTASLAAHAINPLDALSSIVSSATSTTNFQIADIVGTWQYQSPAVSFQSDQALSKIGGMAASTAIEDKLAPYYSNMGLTSLVVTINDDETFSMKIKSITLNGTLTKDSDNGALTFHFNAFGKISIGAVAAMAQKSATNNLTLTFEASKLITIADKVASIAKIQSLSTVVSLLKGYDGIYVGARLKKTASSGNSTSSKSSSSSSSSSAADALKSILGK